MLTHPEIVMYPVADMDYFIKPELFAAREWYIDRDDEETWQKTHSCAEYTKLFDGLFEPGKIVGQKDADLLFWRPAHARLKRCLPETRFIFVLRDPVKRAESQYWNEVAKGRETSENFEEALEKEEERSRASDYGRLHLNYRERGKYIESIEHFRNHINDERFLIVILEKLKNDPDRELARIAEFLGISSEGFAQARSIHSNRQEVMEIKEKYRGTPVESLIRFYDRFAEAAIVRYTRDKDIRDALRRRFKSFGKESVRQKKTLSPALERELREYYRESIEALEHYLGYSIDEWKGKSPS